MGLGGEKRNSTSGYYIIFPKELDWMILLILKTKKRMCEKEGDNQKRGLC